MSGYPPYGGSGYPPYGGSGYPSSGGSGSGYPSTGGSGYPSSGGSGYGAPPPQQQQPYGSPYGGAPPSAPYAGGGYPGDQKPQKPGKVQGGGYGGGSGAGSYPPPTAYGSPFAALLPSAFPPGTDPNIVACFQAADADGSGFIDDMELQRALSSYNQSFSIRTVHLLMYLFTFSNVRKIGPKEFVSVFYSLQNWRGIFETFDRDRSGKIEADEMREALMSLGYSVPPTILELLVCKFDKYGGKGRAIEYDNFIECCLTVKGLTDKFKEKDVMYSGSATFTYEAFMLAVLPFLVA